jgi:hypothetical protein
LSTQIPPSSIPEAVSVSRSGQPTSKASDLSGDILIKKSVVSEPILARQTNDPEVEDFSSSADEPWILAPDEFSAPPAASDTFPGQTAGKGQTAAAAGFLWWAVGSIQESMDFGKKTFDYDQYVWKILEEVYKIPVKMTGEEMATRYREKNNKSARDNMEFVRQEVDRLVKSGQVIKVKKAPHIVNPLSVAYKINADGTYKARLVTDLSRWVNKFVIRDRYRLQDALAQSSKGDYQNVFDITEAYYHIRLHPESYELVVFCVESPEGVEEFYHYVVLVFGLGPAGQALGRVIRPILSFLCLAAVRRTMYVDDGRTLAG